MKKAAIFTWCDNNGVTNYGQIFQCYAMTKLCGRMGIESKIIYFRKRDANDFVKRNASFYLFDKMYELVYKLLKIEKKLDRRIIRFRRFIRRNINVSGPCYCKEDVEKRIRDIDILICGSDQIWNPLWFNPVYAIDGMGVKGQKKIAYAPSGVFYEDEYCNNVYSQIAACIEKFDAVSVREEYSVGILNKYTDKKIYSVLDPTLLLKVSEWKKVMAKRLVEEPYVLCYMIGDIRKYKPAVRRIMKECGAVKVIYIPTNLLDGQNKSLGVFEACTDAGPAEFLSLIYYADMICTDSFHGMAISIKFEKQFCIMGRAQAGSDVIASEERQNNVLRKLGIAGRKVSCVRDAIGLERIDYELVNKKLEEESEKSFLFLKNAVEG